MFVLLFNCKFELILLFQDFSISTLRPVNNHWVDAALAGEGVTYLDSYGAVVNITLWVTGHPFSPPRPYIYLSLPSSSAFDYNNTNSGFISSKLRYLILCASVRL